jgi:fructokinase
MILCCGEALIDMLPRQLPDGSNVFLPVSGGAIFNTAIALGRLGFSTGFVSGVSADMFGDQLIESLEQSGVSTKYCVRKDKPSTLAFVKLTNGHAEYSFYDENSAGRLLEYSEIPEIPSDAKAMHFGAISLIPEPCGSTYETLMSQHSPNLVISFDPNIRPSFITDVEAHRDRMERMAAMSDIIKVSDEDLAWIANGADEKGLLQNWLANGCSVVIMTRGAEGASLYTKNGEISVPPVKAEVVDTVGAGDTFNAGFLGGLEEQGILTKSALASASKDQLLNAGNLAAKVAAMTVAKAGSNSPWRSELEA